MFSYDIKAYLDPNQQTLQADAKVTFLGEWDKPKFCLHKDLVLDIVEGRNIVGHKFTDSGVPFSPEGRGIELITDGPVKAVRFMYHGKLGITSAWEVNRISPDWTELGLYTPWFPLSVPMQDAVFSVQLHLPPSYSVVSSGKIVEAEGHWLIEQSVSAPDLTIIVARNFYFEEAVTDDAVVKASYIDTQAKPVAVQFTEIGGKVLAWLNSNFGPTQTSPVDIVIAPRLKGGGYARRGFIVLAADSVPDDEVFLYRYIAHEFAHLWWFRANTSTWEDWLNESMAEFTALLAVRKMLGREPYSRLLAARKENGKNLPAIRGIDRQDELAYSVLYSKGPVILSELEADLGEVKFMTFLQELIRHKITKTEEFLNILSQFVGKTTSQAFALKLGS